MSSHSNDFLPNSDTTEVVASNSCGCGVSSSKQCGSGSVTKTFKIRGQITVNEEIERHEKSGQKNCNDARSYKTQECATRADGSSLSI